MRCASTGSCGVWSDVSATAVAAPVCASTLPESASASRAVQHGAVQGSNTCACHHPTQLTQNAARVAQIGDDDAVCGDECDDSCAP
jgi:hypothetical protein